MARDTSRDGLDNKILAYALSNLKPFWNFIQSNKDLKRKANKFLLNSLINKIPNRPFPYSLMTLEDHIPGTDKPKKTDTYTSWDSLTDRSYTGRHLPPDPEFNKEGNLPPLKDLKVLFQKRDGKTTYSEKSTLLFPYWVQWFTDAFLRTDHYNRPLFFYSDPETGTIDPQFEGLYQPLNDEQRQSAEKKKTIFAMGVERANVQIGYTMLNTLCLREHNRLCDVLSKSYPDWDDERLFQTARMIVMVIILNIIMEEYIYHITPYNFNFFADPEAFTEESWHRTNWMAAEFSLVYRWHSALPETFTFNGEKTPMAHSLWNNQMFIDMGLGALMEETSTQPGTKIGLFNTPDFAVKDGYSFIDVTELATVQEYAQQKLRELYGHVDKIEFFVGLYAEDVRPNSAIPSLVSRIIGIDAFSQALTNPLLSDKIFKPETFSEVGWEIIQNTKTVGDLVNRNVPASDPEYKVTFNR